MSRKANPTVIGIFTLVGLLLVGAGLVLFGAGKLFSSHHEVLLYFDKSANGLLVGSDVRFGGVRIGRVQSISVIVDREENRKIIPVVVELAEKDLRLISSSEGAGIDFSTFEGVAKAVLEGLRAGMKQQSLVTGQLYIEFDIVPGTPGFTYTGRTKPEHPVIPTIGTEMDELIAGISDGIEKFNSLDLENTVKDLRDLLANANRRIEELNIREINENLVAITADIRRVTGDEKLADSVDKLHASLTRIDSLTRKADDGFGSLRQQLDDIMKTTSSGLQHIDQAVAEIKQLSNPRSPALLRLNAVLQETERASRALKELSNDLKRNPKAILSGKANQE